MKIIKNIVFILIVFAITAFIGAYIYVQNNGKQWVEKQLSRVFGRQAIVGKASYVVPFGIELIDVEVPGSLKISRAQIFFKPNQKNLILVNKINLIDPVVSLKRTEGAKLILGGDLPKKSDVLTESVPQEQATADQGQVRPDIMVKSVEVRNGQLQLTDQLSDRNLQLQLKNIELKATVINYPIKPVNSNFDLTALIVSEQVPFSGSRLEAKGWINLIKRDLTGGFKIIDPKGTTSLEADLQSTNNDMTVKGQMSAGKFMSSVFDEDRAEKYDVENVLFGMMGAADISMKFNFRTKMDQFTIDTMAFSGGVGVGN